MGLPATKPSPLDFLLAHPPTAGVFGCHTALVLRRLRRLCQRVYDSSPTFVVTTATVANPQEHACQLLGVERVEGESGLLGSGSMVITLHYTTISVHEASWTVTLGACWAVPAKCCGTA